MPRNEYGCVHHFMRPLWPSTTWNSWMRSRFSVSATSIRSASPRVPTSEKLCSRWSAPKSSQAARNSRLSSARSARVQAPPGGVDLEERVLHEMTVAHGTQDTPARRPVSGRFHAHAPVVLRSVSRTGRAERIASMRAMRIALVSPYSWTYPGGVTRHIEALAGEFRREGHDVRVFSPYDPPDRLSARLHRGARPEPRETPDWLVPLGRTIGVASNGAVSNLAPTPYALTTLRNELRAMRSDVVHVHEPVAPTVGYDVLDSHAARRSSAPSTATRRTRSRTASRTASSACAASSSASHVRIAVSEAAAWTGQRFYGGRYRVIPNGVDLPARSARRPRADGRAAAARVRRPGGRAQGPARPAARLRGAARAHPGRAGGRRRRARRTSPRCCSTRRGVRVLGKVDDERKHAALASADLLVAPSLGGESFGMVLTEELRGRHAGRRVRHRGLPRRRRATAWTASSCPRGDPTALAETLRDLALDPARRAAHGASAPRERASATPGRRVAAEVLGAYEDAVAMPAPRGAPRARRRVPRRGARPTGSRAARRGACRASSPSRPRRARRCARSRAAPRSRIAARRRRRAVPWLALQRIGLDQIGRACVAATPVVGARRARADVPVDGRPRASPGTRSCARALPRAPRAPRATRCRARSSAC